MVWVKMKEGKMEEGREDRKKGGKREEGTKERRREGGRKERRTEERKEERKRGRELWLMSSLLDENYVKIMVWVKIITGDKFSNSLKICNLCCHSNSEHHH